MKTTSLSLFILLLFACNSSFAQTTTHEPINDSELISIQNKVSEQINTVENKKEIIISIDSKNDLAKSYQRLENKFRQLSVYKLRVVKA